MSLNLDIFSVGAVTSVGLDALQSAAAYRARISGLKKDYPLTPPLEPLTVATIPVHYSLRTTEDGWLVNMAVRAIRESLRRESLPRRIALILTLPEAERMHPGLVDSDPGTLVATIKERVGDARISVAYASDAGGAGIATGLEMARDLLHRREVDACLVGGVDSLVNEVDVDRLRAAGRILEPENPKGLIPGEGAAVILVAPAGYGSKALATLYGVGSAIEQDPVTGTRLSQGRGFGKALRGAISNSGMPESSVSFRVSTVNGEHYTVWESVFYPPRVYRTRRESFPVWYTASSFGDVGAASGALSVAIAAVSIAGGYAPGRYAMCESSSESGLRGACLVGPADGMLSPPFHAEGGASLHVSRLLLRPNWT
jgi:3-oxoacyl-[acyl-carrier-protein] synthase I